MCSLGGGVPNPPLEKGLRLWVYPWLKCTVKTKFFKAGSLKKIRPITLIVWVLGRAKKCQKRIKNFFVCFCFNKYQDVTHVSTSKSIKLNHLGYPVIETHGWSRADNPKI